MERTLYQWSFREFVSKFYEKIQKSYSLIQVQQVLLKCLLWPVCQHYYPKNPFEEQGIYHVRYLDKDQ